MKANLTVGLKDLTGKDVINDNGEKFLLNKFLANHIISQKAEDNAMQCYELAMKLHAAKDEIEIAESEKEIIKKVCKTSGITVLISAQILSIINNAK